MWRWLVRGWWKCGDSGSGVEMAAVELVVLKWFGDGW